MKTGYHVIDATGLDLDDLGTVTGLNAKCKKALEIGKPVFIENVVNGSEKIIPIPVSLMMASTSVNIYAATGNLVVSSADAVSVLSDSAKSAKKK